MAMPKTTNPQAAKFIRAIARPYDVLASTFKDGNNDKLYAEFHVAQNVWQNVSARRPKVGLMFARTTG
jgi:hypothetical protein